METCILLCFHVHIYRKTCIFPCNVYMKAQYHVLLQLVLTFDPHWKRVHWCWGSAYSNKSRLTTIHNHYILDCTLHSAYCVRVCTKYYFVCIMKYSFSYLKVTESEHIPNKVITCTCDHVHVWESFGQKGH